MREAEWETERSTKILEFRQKRRFFLLVCADVDGGTDDKMCVGPYFVIMFDKAF